MNLVKIKHVVLGMCFIGSCSNGGVMEILIIDSKGGGTSGNTVGGIDNKW